MTIDDIKLYKNILLDPAELIFGISGLKRKYNISKSDIIWLRDHLKNIGEYDLIMKICRSKKAKYRASIRNSKPVTYSIEAKKKMSLAQKNKWEQIKNTPSGQQKIETARKNIQSMIQSGQSQTSAARKNRVLSRKKNCPDWFTAEGRKNQKEGTSFSNKNRIITSVTREKMKTSAIARGNCKPIGWKHTTDTRKKLSEITIQMHKDGKFKRVFKSKGHICIENILTALGYTIVSEHRISSRPYDIYVKELNLLIEFNGTYWHLDPKIYTESYYDKSKNRYAKDVWEYDKSKIKLAESNGFNILVIWQREFESQKDQNKYIKEKIKLYEQKISNVS